MCSELCRSPPPLPVSADRAGACQVLYAWGSYPKLDNFVFKDISKGAVQAVHRALQHAVLRQRFARLDWFDIGLTVADLIRLHDLPVDVLCTFNVSAARMVDHDANNYGENWAQYFSWTVADWRRLGIDSIEYQEALKRQRVRSGSRTHLIAARTRWGPQEMPQLVAPWQGLRQ